MHIWDWLYLTLPLVIMAALSFLIAWRKPAWPPWRLGLVSVLIVAVPLWVFAAVVFIDAATASAESCGVDACGMAMMAAMVVSASMLGLALLGWTLIAGLHALLGRI